MPRYPREAKSKALQSLNAESDPDEEFTCPPPLGQRIANRLLLSELARSSSSTAQPHEQGSLHTPSSSKQLTQSSTAQTNVQAYLRPGGDTQVDTHQHALFLS